MESSQFNIFDVFVAFTLVASGAFAFRRGLVKEVMALGTWVLASIFSFTFYPLARPLLEHQIENAMLADAVAAVGLFALAIVLLVPISDYLSNLAKNPTLNAIDRSLGFVFGILRGFLILCLVFLGATYVWTEDPDNQPKWLSQAKTTSALAYGVNGIRKFVPEDPDDKAKDKVEETREAAKEAIEDAKRLDDISVSIPVYRGKSEEATPSYGDDIREEMDDFLNRNKTDEQ